VDLYSLIDLKARADFPWAQSVARPTVQKKYYSAPRYVVLVCSRSMKMWVEVLGLQEVVLASLPVDATVYSNSG